uniref:Peptidase A2 domain-containing protein n=1 Tax=Salvator merianae TaxID=96440 RepID=A0A8D0DIH0_SALMN
SGQRWANLSQELVIAGSAGLDLTDTSAVEFKFPYEVQLCDTQIRGPLPSQTVRLILPQSSANKKGIFVVPGVIDTDYTGILKVQLWTNLPQTPPEKTSVSQLILLPYVTPGASTVERGDRGFGSTDICYLSNISLSRPMLTLQIQGIHFTGLIDTGADVMVISAGSWPPTCLRRRYHPCGA